MKSKKFIIIFVCIFSLIFGAIFFDTHYAVIDKKIYKNDIKKIAPSLNNTSIREINKCTEMETLLLLDARENSFSGLRNFHNLKTFFVMFSELSSEDSEKISTFDNLKYLNIEYSTVDFKGFNSDTVSTILFIYSNITNFKVLSECTSLKSISIHYSIISDCIDNNYVMKDSSVFSSFDYVESLRIGVGKIEDVSGFLEMDSLKELKVYKGSLSEENIKLLENKGISVIEDD